MVGEPAGYRGDGRGDRFTALYRRHYAKVLGYALAYDQRGLAEDIANETFLTAWRKLEDVPEDDPLPWLFAVARNHRLQQYAAGRRHRHLADRLYELTDERDEVTWDVGDLVVDREEAMTAFAALSESDAEVLILTAWYGFSAAQAAHVLGCSTATYYVRLHRARHRFARGLKAGSGPTPSHVRHLEGYQG